MIKTFLAIISILVPALAGAQGYFYTESTVNINAGAAIVTLGSMAVKHPEIIEEWIIEFGAGKLLIGADVLNEKIIACVRHKRIYK